MTQPKIDLLELTKSKLGILSSDRDTLISAIIEGVKSELNDFNNIPYNEDDAALNMYISELSCWRYQNAGNPSLPPYLRLWLNNLILRGMKTDEP